LTGGWKPVALIQTLTPQAVFIEASRNQLPVRETVDGRTVQPTASLIGLYDMDIRNGDTFTLNQATYEVVFVYPDRSYETRADVMISA
jgi:hypothetical protein